SSTSWPMPCRSRRREISSASVDLPAPERPVNHSVNPLALAIVVSVRSGNERSHRVGGGFVNRLVLSYKAMPAHVPPRGAHMQQHILALFAFMARELTSWN